MAKIITITANTAIDNVVKIRGFVLGATLLAQDSVNYPAGKGINVAKALVSLNCPVTTLGFVGDQSKNLFSTLQSSLMSIDLTDVPGQSRTNITLSDMDFDQETHIRTTGYRVTSSLCNQLLNKINRVTDDGDILVLSGSLPHGAPHDFYRKIIESAKNKGLITLLDSSGSGLIEGLKGRPHWFKPNLKELEEVCEHALTTETDVIYAARKIVASGVKKVVVSQGKDGVILVTENSIMAAYIDAVAEPIQTKVGCGDALVAGVAYRMLNDEQLDQRNLLRSGVACATANLLSPEPGSITLEQVEAITRQVKFRSLSL
ncbi:MAG: hexose kinase [Methylococcaceae bacterium]